MLSNQVTIFSGGKGNFPKPCRINDTPKTNLKIHGANTSKGLATLSKKIEMLIQPPFLYIVADVLLRIAIFQSITIFITIGVVEKYV